MIVTFSLLVLLASLPVQAAPTVRHVAVTITSTEGALPIRVNKRMEASVSTVGSHVFKGRAVSEIEDGKVSYERIIRDVIDRVLVGYSVQDIRIQAGETVLITLAVAPWGDIVRDISLEVDFGSLSPDIAKLIQKDIGTLQEDLSGVLIGLPIDAVDWAGGVSKAVIREVLTSQLPEFRSNLDIVSGSKTTVKLTLVPQGPVVQDTKVIVRSRTIPNVLLFEVKPVIEQTSLMMNGLPVAFVQRHSSFFADRLVAATKDHSVAKRYGLTLTSKIVAGTETAVEMKVETSKYSLSLEGYIDMGKKQDNTTLKLHAGTFIGKSDELFTEAEFVPSSVTWQFYPGWSHKLGSTTQVGVKYGTEEKTMIWWFNQHLEKGWIVRGERNTLTGQSEFGIRYKIHDFLSAEYVFGDQEKWLRVIGHL